VFVNKKLLAGIRLISFIGFDGYDLHALCLRAYQVRFPVPVEQWNPAIDRCIMISRLFRKYRIRIEIVQQIGENGIKGMYELVPVIDFNPVEVAQHPAFGCEFPIIGEANKSEIRSDIWKERKLAAARCAIIPLTKSRTLACQQKQMLRGLI
jgi:hypothetical protein